jgi:alkanesulfonate monooxygenase SsuD/methylene tetrahydromethanopterin reductase-like flavin-dependent oxidoreductase (luciferase family)
MKGAISVDHLSSGRFELGMGSGWHEQEALAFGIDFPSQGQRFKVLEGQMQAVNKWRKGERVTQSSPSVELRDASMVPGIMGKMPLWIGGLGPKQTLRMAGAYADGWNAAYASPAQYRELNGILDDWCVDAGREPAAVERSINLSYALSTEDVGVVKAQLHEQWGSTAERIISGSLLGRPDDVMEQVAAFVDAGAEMVNIAIRPPWNQELLAEYVENIVPLMKREWG